MSVALFTATDSGYFGLAQGAIESIRAARPDIDIFCLDLGCNEGQLSWLREYATIERPEWPFRSPRIADMPHHYLALFCRPFMREIAPGYEVYLWFDADAWAQDRSGLDLLIEGAERRRGLAAVPEIDRCSQRHYGGFKQFADNLRPRWAVFGQSVADTLCCYPMLNGGITALHVDAPHWKPWADAIEQALDVACHFLVEQMALSYIVYLKGLLDRTELLPMWCNWLCHNGLPAWDSVQGCFVEPYLPNTKIGNVHLTFRDKQARRRIKTTDFRDVAMELMYPVGVAV